MTKLEAGISVRRMKPYDQGSPLGLIRGVRAVDETGISVRRMKP